MNILLGVTGSVAAIKLPKLIFSLRSVGELRTVATDSALKIISKIDGFQLQGNALRRSIRVGNNPAFTRSDPFEELYTDKREWFWERIGDPVLHIDLKDWADVLVIAPLTANTLAKMANGLCDNLLTCIVRAWPNTKDMVLAPAMNTDMWDHRVTQGHLSAVDGFYRDESVHPVSRQRVFVVGPVKKKLACGTTGMGAMANVETIVGEVVGAIERYAQERKDA
jgi:phosphopantothenoylcysteine decarboxylase